MNNLQITNLNNENEITDLTQEELSNIHGGGEIYIYTYGPDGSIIRMELVRYSGAQDLKLYV